MTEIAKKESSALAASANTEFNTFRIKEYQRQIKYRDMADRILLDRNVQREFFDRCSMVASAGAYGHKQANTVWIAAHFGMSMGMSFSQAIKRVKVIHGTPTLRGQAAINTIHERVAGAKCRVLKSSETACTWRFERPGHAPMEVTYTMEQATKQGLVARNSNYKTFPEDMLMWQCASIGAKRMFGDVLDGMYVDEDLERAISEAEASVDDFDEDKGPTLSASASKPAGIAPVDSRAQVVSSGDPTAKADADSPREEIIDAEVSEPAAGPSRYDDEAAREAASAKLSDALTEACGWRCPENPRSVRKDVYMEAARLCGVEGDRGEMPSVAQIEKMTEYLRRKS